MYRLRILAVAMMFLLPAALAWSQDTRDDAKPQQEEAKPHDEKPQDQMKPPKDQKQDEKAHPQEAKPARDEHGRVQSNESRHTPKKPPAFPMRSFGRISAVNTPSPSHALCRPARSCPDKLASYMAATTSSS